MITPDTFAGKTPQEISSMSTYSGNRVVKLGDLFKIEGQIGDTPSETSILVEGDIPSSRRLGSQMTAGTLIITGRAGLYVGEKMKGGELTVNSDVGPWVGVEMTGGIVRVQGHAGDYVGASYRGTRTGMTGGTIIIDGNVGAEAGCWMIEGEIIIHGNAGPFVGIHMEGGSVLVRGDCKERAGASMTGGKVILLGKTPSILPGFQIEEIRKSVKLGADKFDGPFYTFLGDRAELGNGRLHVHGPSNPFLKHFEDYLA